MQIIGWHFSILTCKCYSFPSRMRNSPVFQRPLGIYHIRWVQECLRCKRRTRCYSFWLWLVRGVWTNDTKTTLLMCISSDWVKLYLGKKNGTHVLGCTWQWFVRIRTSHINFKLDNEFTQLMKGLQGERLRQAFKFLDADEDGFIRPDQFKRIILVGVSSVFKQNQSLCFFRKSLVISFQMQWSTDYQHCAHWAQDNVYLILKSLRSIMS
jgi:hypothetical protein